MPRIAGDIVRYSGTDVLTSEEKRILDKLSAEYFEKMKRSIKNIAEVIIHIKAYEEEGRRKKFSIDLRVNSPILKTLISTRSHDWDFSRAVHKAFHDIESQLSTRLHLQSGRGYKKPYE